MSMNLNILRKYIREILNQELEEASVTGAIDGGAGPPKTPRAFRKKNSKKIKKAGFEDGHKKPAVFGFVKVNEAKFHIRTDFGSVLVDAGSKGEAKMIVAKKLKGGVKAIISVKRVGVSQAKQVDKKIEAHIPFHPGGKKTTIEDEPEEKRKKESVTEGKYHDYRNDESLSPKQKIGYSMREVRDKLNELDKLVKMNVRLKNEIGVDSTSYWKRTHGAMKKISERLVKLANKVGQLY